MARCTAGSSTNSSKFSPNVFFTPSLTMRLAYCPIDISPERINCTSALDILFDINLPILLLAVPFTILASIGFTKVTIPVIIDVSVAKSFASCGVSPAFNPLSYISPYICAAAVPTITALLPPVNAAVAIIVPISSMVGVALVINVDALKSFSVLYAVGFSLYLSVISFCVLSFTL